MTMSFIKASAEERRDREAPEPRHRTHTAGGQLGKLLPILLALLPADTSIATPPTTALRPPSLSFLEQRLAEINNELATLASYSMESGTGAIGYRSNFHEDEFQKEWIQIDFEAPHTLDEVVLVPVIRRDTQSGFEADGFPRQFRLIAGTDNDPTGRIIAEYTNANEFLPRIAPLSIPCEGEKASWIRIEVDRLSLRAFDERFVLQLSEIMVFSGQENVALHQTVTAKSNSRDGLAWDQPFIADGFVPYIMDAATGRKSVAFVGRIESNTTAILTIDLGKPAPLSRLQLHAIETSDFLPKAFENDFGIPRRMKLQGANTADFSDAKTLLNLNIETVYEVSPIMTWAFPETLSRYLQLRIITPPADPLSPPRPPRFGFAEIELFSKGKNVAFQKMITAVGTLPQKESQRFLSHLTDGRNIYGDILPIREWMRQLARRHDLETEHSFVMRELNRRYEHQKATLRRLGWLAALLAAGIGFTILIDRLLRMRQIRNMEQRIAADLHDELGANLHTIGLLSDLAESSKDNPEELALFHQRIRAVTERSGIAVRNCTNMFSSNALHKGLVADMQRAAQRIMARLDHTLSIEGEEYIRLIKRRTCFDLFLFYKECLVNISRHSGATRFKTRLQVTPHYLDLTISDNGRGLSEPGGNGIPASLKRRAKLLKTKVSVETPPNGGTCIHLHLKLKTQKQFFSGKLS